jgi:hypothetical protein
MPCPDSSAQAEEAKNGQDDYDQADEVDDAVHLGNSMTQFDESQNCHEGDWLLAGSNLVHSRWNVILLKRLLGQPQS